MPRVIGLADFSLVISVRIQSLWREPVHLFQPRCQPLTRNICRHRAILLLSVPCFNDEAQGCSMATSSTKPSGRNKFVRILWGNDTSKGWMSRHTPKKLARGIGSKVFIWNLSMVMVWCMKHCWAARGMNKNQQLPLLFVLVTSTNGGVAKVAHHNKGWLWRMWYLPAIVIL